MTAFSTIAPWGCMWLIAGGIFTLCKGASWSACKSQAAVWKQVAYWFAWPGMDADSFLDGAPVHCPALKEWLFASGKLLLGIGLLWGVVPLLPMSGELIRGWTGMVGLVFVLHFGMFHLLSCAWRYMGLRAVPIMNYPVLSTSLAEFWGCRWNLAFRDLTHRFIFRPLTRAIGPTCALLLGFLVSGLVHDVVISGPSRGGWGLPTLYFLIQGLGLLAERSRAGRRISMSRGWCGRLFCALIVIIPSPLLFHAAFVQNIIVPFLKAIGSIS